MGGSGFQGFGEGLEHGGIHLADFAVFIPVDGGRGLSDPFGQLLSADALLFSALLESFANIHPCHLTATLYQMFRKNAIMKIA